MSDQRPSCDICSEFYDETSRAPRMLACGHTKCHSCLKILIYSESPVCPECRMPIKIKSVEDVPVNIYAIRHINQSHLELNHKSESTNTNIPDKPIIDPCNKHKSESLDSWCKSCNVWCCNTCIFTDHQEPPKGECRILPKKKALQEKIKKQREIKYKYVLKLMKSYQKGDETDEEFEANLIQLNAKKQKLYEELKSIDKTIKYVTDSREKMSLSKILMSNIETSMASTVVELDRVTSICNYTNIENKLGETFKIAQQSLDAAEELYQAVNTNMTCRDAETQTDSTNQKDHMQDKKVKLNFPSNMYYQEIMKPMLTPVLPINTLNDGTMKSSKDLKINHYAVKKDGDLKLYSKVSFYGNTREINALSKELPPQKAIIAKYDDNYIDINNPTLELFFNIEIGNQTSQKVIFKLIKEKSLKVINFFKLITGEVEGKSYRGSKLRGAKLRENYGWVRGGDYEGENGREVTAVIDVNSYVESFGKCGTGNRYLQSNNFITQSDLGNSDPKFYSDILFNCIGNFCKDDYPPLANITVNMKLINEAFLHLDKGFIGDVTITGSGVMIPK